MKYIIGVILILFALAFVGMLLPAISRVKAAMSGIGCCSKCAILSDV